MISVAIQKGNTVYVYNEKNQIILMKSGTLVGYTSTTVSVKLGNGNTIYTYSESGQTISMH